MFSFNKSQLLGAAALFAALLAPAWAGGDFHLNAAPYMPSVGARHALAMLADEADLALVVTHWPQPANAVYEALERLDTSKDKPLTETLQQARAMVRAELLALQKGSISTTLRNRAEGFVGFGDDYTPGSSVQVQSPVWLAGSADGWRVSGRIAARIEDNANPMVEHPSGMGGSTRVQSRLTDSALVGSLGAVNVQMFSHNTWWSPGWQSSLLASNNVPAWNAIGVQRAQSGPSDVASLKWLGPWSYEWFVAQAQDPKVVSSGQPTGYLYTGMRITAKPWPWMEVAASRMLQGNGMGHYGGLKGYINNLTGKGSNADTIAQQAVDPGNSLAGFDLRLGCGPLGLRCALYAQAMGEDSVSAGLGLPMPYRFLTLGGLETWSADGRYRWFVEYADTHCQVHGNPSSGNYPSGRSGCAYVNGQYPQGETNATRWQGSSFGPDSVMSTVGWYDAQNRRLIKFMRGEVGTSVGSYNPALGNVPRGPAWGLNVKQTMDWQGVRWSPELAYMHLANGQDQVNYRKSDLRIGLTASMSLFDPVRTSGAGLFGVTDSRYSLWSDFTGSSKQVADRVFSSEVTPGWAWALGGVLAARAIDRRVDNWAIDHATGSYKTVGKVGSNTPILLAGAVGLMGLGLADDESARLAGVAATASVMALAGNTALKVMVGRARPELNQGDASFNNFNTKAMSSSFASSHTAVAFALLTPFAQAYDMPWLYGLGVLTALGRIQERQHWLSDTVAGGAMGYAISSAMMNTQGGYHVAGANSTGPQVSVMPNRVQVAWAIK